jgi:hypothetical protein
VLRREGDAAAQYAGGLGFRSVDLAAPVRHPITGENVPLEGWRRQAHRRWKMCDGWPAGPAPSRFYSTPIGTDPDLYSPLPSLGARLTLPLHDDACAPSAKGRGRLIRCTVPGSTPNRLAMTRTPGLPGVARASRNRCRCRVPRLRAFRRSAGISLSASPSMHPTFWPSTDFLDTTVR